MIVHLIDGRVNASLHAAVAVERAEADGTSAGRFIRDEIAQSMEDYLL